MLRDASTRTTDKRNQQVNPLYRHEWVSVRLFMAFVGQDDDAGWLSRLAQCDDSDHDAKAFVALWLDYSSGRLLRDGIDPAAKNVLPFGLKGLPKLAQAVAWLVFTHHRLPCIPVTKKGSASSDRGIVWDKFGSMPTEVKPGELPGALSAVGPEWNKPAQEFESSTDIDAEWDFPHGLPVAELSWRRQAASDARALLGILSSGAHADPFGDRFVMHVSRLCLMLADHHYSRVIDQDARAPYLNRAYPIFANTRKGVLNQTLDEHLLGVSAHSKLITKSLPELKAGLPSLIGHQPLGARTSNARFAWQDNAADLAASVRQKTALQGGFVVNMASTGCGKTLGNARIMNSLADPVVGLRCAFAIGLRTLTLQTGRSFQNDIHLTDGQLAIQVGGAANRDLFEYWERQAEATGSASAQDLTDEAGVVLHDGMADHPLLGMLGNDQKAKALISAPVLVCTVDHLTPATESLRGGRQIAPMLRLMTGDLVLDEPDDFDMADLPALARLAHWAGLLGSRVLLSSATLPPALVEGLFLAYQAGRSVYQRHHEPSAGAAAGVCCLWVDEFNAVSKDCVDGRSFRAVHQDFVCTRVERLEQADVRRLAQIVALPQTWPGLNEDQRRKEFAKVVLQQAWSLHQVDQNHSVDPASGKRVSVGLIRMANIDPLYDVALAMYEPDVLSEELRGKVRVHLCVYHSQFPLLQRSAIENRLDRILNRRGWSDARDPVLQQPEVRSAIDAHDEIDHLFIVLGSPVAEVGRDHDYDWAVVEPSSMRSIIQLAGRVRRHRSGSVEHANLSILDTNLRHYEQVGGEAFCRPGFEGNGFKLITHSLFELLKGTVQTDGLWSVDACPRIVMPTTKQKWSESLVMLEHMRMLRAMLPKKDGDFETKQAAYLHWQHDANLWLTGLMPQLQRFRHDNQERVDVAMLPNEDEDDLELHRVQDMGEKTAPSYPCIHQSECKTVPESVFASASVSPWPDVRLLNEVAELAASKGLTMVECAKRYATAHLPDTKGKGWLWHERTGFKKAG